jgi:hypothetical protein
MSINANQHPLQKITELNAEDQDQSDAQTIRKKSVYLPC